MEPSEIMKWLNPKAFEPFELQLSTGEWIPVRHSEHLVVTKRASIVLDFGGPEDPIANDHVLISNLHIVKLQHLNGATSRRK